MTSTKTTTDSKTETTEEVANAKQEMEYRLLGNTGLKVSVLSYGFYATMLEPEKHLPLAVNIMRHCREAGINLFDNAEFFGSSRGDGEILMGKAIKILRKEDPVLWRRSELVIVTKLFWGGDGQNERGLSRKHLQTGINGSLKRLQLDYVDVVLCNRPDPLTTTEEVVRAMTQLVTDGKAHYWGTSMWDADHIMEAIWTAKSLNLIGPCMEQCQYNMNERKRMEKDYLRLFAYPYRMGTTTWGPLNAGILTGKYNDGIPEDSRIAKFSVWKRYITEDNIAKVKVLTEYAKKELNCSITVMAIAWCTKNANVSTVLLGARKESQILENLKAMELATRLTKKNMDDIEKILGNIPEQDKNWGREVKKFIETV